MTDDTKHESGKPAFDREVLHEHTSGDVELTQELVRLCLEECPVLVGKIRQAVAARDATQLRLAAHTLRGALMNFGAQRAVGSAEELELLAKEQKLDTVDEVHRELEAAWGEFEQELKDYLG